jgi:RimJ/RimL family protein N-acetyltransferase
MGMSASAVKLHPFDPVFGPTVASWADDQEELFWLAPSTPAPLTATAVVNWTKERGHAYLLFAGNRSVPCGYGELNPMRRDPNQFWLGHLIIDPAHRGQGLGRCLTQLLVKRAFRRARARRVILIVFPENAVAVKCYLQCGFRCRGRESHRFRTQPGKSYEMLRLEIDAESPAAAPTRRGAVLAP